MEIELKPGDKVWHKSNRITVWIIEKIEDGDAYCSTLTKNNEHQKEKFSIVTIEKYERPKIESGGTEKRNNHW